MTADRITRRTFLKTTSAAVLAAAASSGRSAEAAGGAIRLGGPIFARHDSPESWIAALQTVGYRAAYCPLSPTADDATVSAYAAAAKRADITIAEVGAWSNP
ncbi:MAG TPA: sugar phosphate isomerase/epimerase, partial [Phycisphaerales bacterium]|nr:sugar phosphate isomerase/epimerase [Phycisphaerales bacterium]